MFLDFLKIIFDSPLHVLCTICPFPIFRPPPLAVSSLLRPLRQLVAASPRIAHTVFVDLFARVWSALDASDHARLQVYHAQCGV
jgi:hypothetical protein